MTSRAKIALALLGLAVAGLALMFFRDGLGPASSLGRAVRGGGGPSETGEASQRPLRIGIGTSSAVGDFGWSHGQNLGRLALEAHLLQQVETFLWEGVYERVDCERALAGFADAQVDLAFIIGERNQDAVQAWAGQHPQAKVVQWYGSPQPPNVAACAILDNEAAYLCGAVAALVPESGGRLGVLAAHGTQMIRWVANAFTLGAQSIRPDIEVEFRVLNSWYDPLAERAAVEAMAAQGVGAVYVVVVAPVQAVVAAEGAGICVLSHFGDQSELAPTRWLTGTERLWHRLYADVTRRVLDGTWEPTTYQGGLKEGYVRLAAFGPSVTVEAIGQIREMARAVSAGERPLYAGPLRDAQGNLRVPEGEVRSWDDLVGQDWMVEGIRETPVP